MAKSKVRPSMKKSGLARGFASRVAARLGLTFSEETFRRQQLELEERRTRNLELLEAFQAAQQALQGQSTRRRTTASAARTTAPPVPSEALIAALKAKCPRDTGALAASLTAEWNGEQYVVRSPGIPYGRIQDYGGRAGKDHKALLAGHFYTAKAAAAVGVDPGLVVWAEVPDA